MHIAEFAFLYLSFFSFCFSHIGGKRAGEGGGGGGAHLRIEMFFVMLLDQTDDSLSLKLCT